jgi:PAS domain S-box-containing protein
MGELMAAIDWTRTPLGPVDEWPASLRTSLDICLRSRFPILVWWGDDLVMLYNDAYRPMLGQSKHPRALGARGRDIWTEIWPIIGPMLDGVLKGRGATWSDNQLLLVNRNNYLEECYFTFSYSPIAGEDRKIGGVFTAVQETTEQVIGERRLTALRALGDEAGVTGTPTEACRRSAAILERHLRDVPFALIYLIGPDGTARLAGRAGIGADHPGAGDAFQIDDPAAPWPLANIVAAGEPSLVPLPATWAFPAGDWEGVAERAYLLPLPAPGRDGTAGVLVAGLSPRRAFDRPYADFFQLVAGHIATAVANATAYEAERARAEGLAELDRAKTVFFSNVSHEFRTPLTLSLGPLVDALNDGVEPLAPVHRERIEIAHRNSLRLLKLVNTLLDFSRIEAGRAQAQFEPTDLGALTADLASTFRSTIERAGLLYRVDCRPLARPVYVDHDMWEKIVLNLLSNAYKFTLQGTISVSVEQTSTHAVLTVSDTGTGIPPAELPRLFDRFHQVRNARGRSVEGTGIGLALVKELVRLHDGQIDVRSEEGAGSTFRVSVPLGTAHAGAGPAGPAAERSTMLGAAPFVEEALRWSGDAPTDHLEPGYATPPGGLPIQLQPEGRILLADDNADMRAYVERLLGRRWSVEAVADGRAALTSAQASKPALVISDVMMPGLSGVELLAALRADARTRGVPVILLSARAGEEARVEGLAAGADDYMVKPFGARELLARVDATLALARLRAESSVALRTSETRYRSLAEATAQMIWSADPAGRFNAPSPSWEAYTGQRWEEYRDLGFIEAIHPDDRQRTLAAWAEGLKGEEPCAAEYRLRRADGQYRQVVARCVPVRNSGGWVTEWVGTVTDIEDQRSAETRLRQAAKMEAIGRLAGGLAHDFNNQLQAVAGFATFIEREENLGPGAQADLEQIKKAADRMASLTRQLLAFARQQVLAPETLDLNAAIEDTMPMLQRLIGSNVKIQLELAPGPKWVRVDRAQLVQVLLNLIINARDAMDGGRIVLRTLTQEVSPGTVLDRLQLPVDAGAYAMLSVADTGRGIPPEHMPHIFEPFYTTKEVGVGTGLGLATVEGVVAQSGGRIQVDSKVDRGTTITVLLPLTSEPVVQPRSAGYRLKPNARSLGRILVVEDEDAVRTVVMRTLQAEGYEVLGAREGNEALQELEEVGGAVNLVVTDIVMPGMGGRQLAAELSRKYRRIPIVWMSGHAREAELQRGELSRDEPFLQKPVSADTLLETVAQVIERNATVGS